MSALDTKELNILRGKNLASGSTAEDVNKLFQHIDALEDLLDEADDEDFFGTQGWRYRAGIGG